MESPQQNLTDIFYFVQVVQHGSLTGAARALGVAKSRLSSRLAHLEQQLGVRLIQRTTRRLHVTEVGHSYCEHCRSLLDAAEQAQHVIDDAKDAPRGRIRIASPSSFVQMLLGPILVGFLDLHPAVQIELDMTNRPVDVVADGYDIAFGVRASLEDSSLVVRSFGFDPHVLVGAPALLERAGRLHKTSDLKHLPSLATTAPSGRHFWMLRQDKDGAGTQVEHHPKLVSDDLLMLRQAAILGVGIAQLPEFVCREALQRGVLKRVLPNWKLPPGNVHAVYPTRRGHTPALRSFIDHVALHLPDMLSELQCNFGQRGVDPASWTTPSSPMALANGFEP
ncbi:MAG: LysR family transcriptional regulator [Proteobacteria bacterium]|nr:LysR family transcriptional regulator [Pseudomonadota bacterium]